MPDLKQHKETRVAVDRDVADLISDILRAYAVIITHMFPEEADHAAELTDWLVERLT